MAGLNWQCCCVGPTQFCEDWVCECAKDYNWFTDGFTIQASKTRLNNGTQACCFNPLMDYEIDLTAAPIGQVLLQKEQLGETAFCCYRAEFDMNIVGTVRVFTNYDIQSGPPLFPNCNMDQTYDVNMDVPCYYTVVCQENGTYRHRVSVCHFQIACSSQFMGRHPMDGLCDCEGNNADPNNPCCFSDFKGLRCAGGVFEWYTDAEHPPSFLLCPDDSSLLVTFGPTICAIEEDSCLTKPPAFNYYANVYTTCGPTWFFGMYWTDECVLLEEFPPCDTAYEPTAGCPLFSPIPYSSEGSWCLGNNGGLYVHIDNVINGCDSYYTFIEFDTGSLV